MAFKKFKKSEILAYKRRALEVAELFGDDLDQETTKLYIKYIEGKKNDLFEKHLQGQRAKQEEKKKDWGQRKQNNENFDSSPQ